jgi:hypothetical protein
MSRVENWEEKLFGVVSSAREQDFKYGRFDCCLFASRVIGEITGQDPADQFGFDLSYENKREAVQTLRDKDYESLEEMVEDVAQKRDWEEKNNDFAHRGDVAVVENEDGFDAVGIVIDHRVVFPSHDEDEGLGYSPRSEAKRVWGVQ